MTFLKLGTDIIHSNLSYNLYVKKLIIYLCYHRFFIKLNMQLSFFNPPQRLAKTYRLMAALDSANKRFGSDTLRVGSAGFRKRDWYMKKNLVSKRYTTSWREIPKVY